MRLFAAILFLPALSWSADLEESRLVWDNLPPLPEPVADHFLGAHNGALIVAAGATVRNGAPAVTGAIYVLTPGADAWRQAGSMQPMAGGASASSDRGVLCIGGLVDGQPVNDAQLLSWNGKEVTSTPLPPLPHGLALAGAAELKDVVYVAGGYEADLVPRSGFLSLDLNDPTAQWRPLPPFPGSGKIRPVVVAQDDAVYVTRGAGSLDDSPTVILASDGYRYNPRTGWGRIFDPGDAVSLVTGVAVGPSHIYAFGPGGIRAYHTITDTWVRPADPNTFGQGGRAALWDGRIVLTGDPGSPAMTTSSVPSTRAVAARIESVPRDIFALDYIVLGLYFVSMVGIGWYFSRREKTTADFFTGGKRVPWWAAGLSIFSTVLSAITFLSIPAMAYRTNWVYLPGNLVVVLIAPIVVYYYLPFFRRLDVTSAYEYLEKRFNLPARLFGSLSFILFQLGRLGIVLYLPSLALSAATGLDLTTAIIVMGVLTIFYTVLGGIEAVIWTDVVQTVVLLGGAILALAAMIVQSHVGLSGFFATAASAGKFRMFDWGWDATAAVAWVVILGRTFENLVPHTSDQSVIQRYLTTSDEKQAARAIWLGNLMAVPSSLLFFMLGTALYVFYVNNPHRLDPTLQTDATFPLFIVEQLPPGITGLIIAALFAAAMSTLDSGMNSVATVVVTDFYRRFKRNVNETSALRLARWITVLVGILGTVSALILEALQSPSLWEQYMKIVGLFGSSLAGLFALGIFTRRATGPGALVGALASIATLATVQHYGPVSFLLYSAIGITTCFVAGYLASLVLGRNRDLTGLTWQK